MNMDWVAKLDRGLRAALRAFEETRAASEPEAAMAVTLRYEGDLAAIEALGFGTTEVVSDAEARGVVRFADVPALAEHPGVLRMSAGREWRKDVHWALPDARVRASSAANVDKDGLWFLPDSGNALASVANSTGKGVIVAIIDGGIDYKHPMFLTPAKETRIKFLWDQGLKGDYNECPKVAKLFSTETYGVEFDHQRINNALKGIAPIAHRDCDGHGTHVAGIAAGGQLSPGFPRRAGVAPEADLIVVKMIGVPPPVKYRKPNNTDGNDVAPEDRFKDAVLWCLNTAKGLNAPVVINMSIGSEFDPGDALDPDAVWVDGLFGASPVKPDAPHFPNRAIVVKGAGNYAQMGARVQFTQNNQSVIVKLKLIDTRGGLLTTWMHCEDKPYKPNVSVTFWYRRDFDNVKFALQLPNEASFGTDLGVGQSDVRSFEVHAGPPPTISSALSSPAVHRVSLIHHTNDPVTHPDGTSIHRHSVDLDVTPKDSSGAITYHTGEYQVRITAPKGTEVFLMCEGEGWARGKYVFFEVVSGATEDPEFTMTSPLGKNVITVSAYDDADGAADHPWFHRIAPFSSRGPLRNFADPNLPNPPGVVADKPDFAAPGVKVSSAQGIDTDLLPFLKLPFWMAGERFIEYSGTSTAAPIVAGIIALLLAKKPDLTVGQVRTLLKAGVRAGADPAPASGAAYTRAFGAGMVGALESHKKIP